MLIRFGLALDGYEAREPCAAPGELTTGPIGLLDYLEARLELGGRRPTRAVRVAQYERCLALADDGGRFYSRSFATDPLGVADTLLDWRDQWVAGGWDGRGDRSDGERLADLADVERVARDVLAPGSADRLSAVAAGLSGCGSSGIDRVQLFDSPGELPRLWRRVLDALNVEIVEWGGWPTPMAPPGSDLTALQGALLGTGRPTFRGDGSVLVLEADSDPALAQGLATCFGPETGWSTADTTVVVGECGGILDLGLRAAGLPVAGLAERSPWRAASQVLRLALNLLWAPLDPCRLLEFLTLPVSPIDDPLRLRLARVVADAPGIGGAAWREVVEALRAKPEGGTRAPGESVDEQVATWLEVRRFEEADGVPVQVVCSLCERVAHWAASRAGREDAAAKQQAFFVAEKEALALRDASTQGAGARAGRLGRLQLERLVEIVTGNGSVRAKPTESCGRLHAVRDPAALIEPSPRVVWWGFLAPPLPGRWPWSAAEIARLRASGVELPSTESRLRAAARSWSRPVLAARAQLLLVRPRRAGPGATTAHPLWDQILVLAEGGSLPTVDVDAVQRGDVLPGPGLPLRHGRVAHRPLPPARRWWQLSNVAALAPREEESYSSLSAFVHVPHQWVLRHRARLLPGSVARLATGNRLKGTILHRLFEQFFTADDIDWRVAAEPEVAAWLAARLPRLLAEEGASLLLPGARREAEALFATAQRAAWALIGQLRAAGATGVRMEVPGQGVFRGGALGGRIDMLIRRHDGREAVVDLKWSGLRYRCDELRQNEQLQLGVYAVLRRGATGEWPAQAYFAMVEARMAAQSDGYFPHARVCTPRDSAGTPALWAAFESTWAWRRGQLDRGRIEVNVTATEPDEHSVPPADGLAIAPANEDFDDYVRLAGWPKEA